ncbi:hypothetical protein RHMOL_Rhmol05G0309800 [Rhododendron molle]|uniref:Uncharacterized protein n=1 Tax=Rhododendron molle TaxID=49168 RepID=A0ACC0NVW6_RHOML|nr:hypothetical protein RHMOL_Rhmol05G0309800 [Rhododendron molle]
MHGKATHGFSIRSGISGYVYIGSALVDMYAKCGRMETSRPCFDELTGWMYQEQSLYCIRKENMMDLDTATELDPTLPYPYKYRAVLMMEKIQMDDHKEAEAIWVTTFPRHVCEAALCLDPIHTDTIELYHRAREPSNVQQQKERS